MEKLNTKQHNQGLMVWGVIGAIAVSGAIATATAQSGAKEAQTAFPAATVTRAINTAVKAKTGNVAGVEVETENGVTKIDVEILASDGNNYEVAVNAATGNVIMVELDNADKKGEMNEQNEKDND